jgi:hypothetical protein
MVGGRSIAWPIELWSRRAPGSAGELVQRSERLTLSQHPTGLTNDFRVSVRNCVFLGQRCRLHGGHPVTGTQKAGGESIGEEAYIGWPAEESLLFPAEGSKR